MWEISILFFCRKLEGVAQNRDIGIVGDNDHLPPLLCASKHRNQRGIDEFTVEIVFRLIDYKRAVAAGGQD